MYLVKFKGEDKPSAWLNNSCFDRPVSYNKRKGFQASDVLFARRDYFTEVDRGFSSDGKGKNKTDDKGEKRKLHSPKIDNIKKRKVTISKKSSNYQNLFIF